MHYWVKEHIDERRKCQYSSLYTTDDDDVACDMLWYLCPDERDYKVGANESRMSSLCRFVTCVSVCVVKRGENVKGCFEGGKNSRGAYSEGVVYSRGFFFLRWRMLGAQFGFFFC
uniref:Uncharacterized protein n=1 Tax=Cacopsylla melanoneura TaxID=428564 RepID=A0A8D9F549_9HEMI